MLPMIFKEKSVWNINKNEQVNNNGNPSIYISERGMTMHSGVEQRATQKKSEDVTSFTLHISPLKRRVKLRLGVALAPPLGRQAANPPYTLNHNI